MQVRLSVDARDAVRALRAVPDALADAVGRWANVGGQLTRTAMVTTIRERQGTVGRTGFLSNSVQVTQDARGFTVAPTAEYALFVDQPTRPHVIRPRFKKALAFAAPGGRVSRTRGGQVRTATPTTGGGVRLSSAVFASYVNHPGTKGMFFAQATAERVAQPLTDLLDREVDRELRGLGEA